MKSRTKSNMKIKIILPTIILGVIAFSLWERDPCKTLEPREQYRCLNPQFYCGKILYESHIKPCSLKDAEQIVLDYIANKKPELVAKIILSAKMHDSYQWYQITCRFSDGTEYGFEVGPDGNIYEIKHLN